MRLVPGSPHPLGATLSGGTGAGVNFALFSEHATRVELCLFDAAGDARERIRVPLPGRTGNVWHGFAPECRPGQIYGYRVDGPWDPARGFRFNSSKVLFDPYARAIGRAPVFHPSLFSFAPGADGHGPMYTADSAPYAPLGIVIGIDSFDWKNDSRPDVSWSDTLIYELHVKGMTALNDDVPADLCGTYLGLAHESVLAHLKKLGVTSVELMPVHLHMDEPAVNRRGQTNYWGYSTLGYFAPDPRFAKSTDPLQVASEFKTMVRKLHAAGLEVILDVVYNHTAEGDERGPTVSFRGIDNTSYYRLDLERPSRYQDFTGTGSTLNMQSPHVRELVMDSLRYRVQEMHVDGFRFDLASALARTPDGIHLLFFEAIQNDPVLAGVKLIAEPWDAAEGGYQVGNFPPGWSEWNGRYRDTIRRFWRGDRGMLPELATRLAGSSDLYLPAGRSPQASINFVTAHDGFTLADLVAYGEKHNDANGENNRDGESHNHSWNCGVEGPTNDEAILERRRRQRRNFVTTLLVSLGVPMLSGGDEMGRTQNGNNNAYCHDSLLTWTSWNLSSDESAFKTFVARVAAFRHAQPFWRRDTFLSGRSQGGTDVLWMGPDGTEMNEAAWNDPNGQVLGMLLDDTVLLLFNGADADVAFTLPSREHSSPWVLVFDTAKPEAGGAIQKRGKLILEARSVLVLTREMT